MNTYFCPEFIDDLKSHGDANFARRVMGKVFGPGSEFRSDQDDHRYHGIENAWIRYVSRGRTAYRVIYIQKGDEVFLYRAGGHDIEDHLAEPSNLSRYYSVLGQSSVATQVALAAPVAPPNAAFVPPQFRRDHENKFLKTTEKKYLNHTVFGRRLVPHKEVYLVSPFLSKEQLARTARFGRILDEFIEDGAKITLITTPPKIEELDFFADLEARSIDVFFLKGLHSKLYIFRTDKEKADVRRDPDDLAIIGSSNLTNKGFGFNSSKPNEELCYVLPNDSIEVAYDYIVRLVLQSFDFINAKVELTKRGRPQWS